MQIEQLTNIDLSVSSKMLSVRNPATLEPVAEVPLVDKEGILQAVNNAREAFPEWSGLSFKERADYLYKVRDALIERQEELIDIVQMETGKVRVDASAGILSLCELIGYYGKRAGKFLADDIRRPHLMKIKKVWVSYHPVGVVGIIAPWNFPLTLSYADAIPALMAGNTVIIKPSSLTPLIVLAMWNVFKEAGFPDNVLQVIPTSGETAGALIDTVDMIAFTGSTETGKKIAERAAKRLIPVLLELGGKDPMIVLKDANLTRAVNGGIWGSLYNSGQVCMSTERIYVDESIADEFINRVVKKAQKLRQGYGADYSCDVGSMTSPEQIEIVEDHIKDAVSKGAKILIGGKRNTKTGSGFFFEPTVIVNVNHNMKVMKEETFGPVIAIQSVKDENEAIKLANDSKYGLGSSIWTKNKRKGRQLARKIQAGFVCINEVMANYVVMEIPFGGIKESGSGVRHGPEGIKNFCNTQSVLSDRFVLKSEFAWYPYSASFYGRMGKVIRLLYGRGLKKFKS